VPEPSNLNAEIAAKVLEANVRNIVEKVKAGGTLNATERAMMESAATKKPETPLQESEAALSAAPFLFSEDEIGFEKLEATGEFTGERLLARRPDVYRAVVRMAAEGQSISATARALGVSRNTVCAVRDREGFSIEQDKKDLLRDVRRAARLSVERAIELVPSINSAKDAAIVAAVMVDKMQLLSGEATSRVEKVEVNQDKLAEMLASLPVLEAEVVDTGLQPSVPSQMPPAASAPGLPSSLVQGVSNTDSKGVVSVIECVSEPIRKVDSHNSFKDNDVQLSSLGVIGSYGLDNADQGGEGVENFEAPPLDSTGLGSQKIFTKGPSTTAPASSQPSTLP
jgi:transposase-like protein